MTVKAVTDLNLTIEGGEIFTMLGANGAGKTTTLMVALGFTDPTQGTVKLCGIDITEQPLEAKKHVAYVSENVMLYGNFSARQNLDFFTRLSGQPPQDSEHYDAIMARVGLQQEAFDRRVKEFSKGMRQSWGLPLPSPRTPASCCSTSLRRASTPSPGPNSWSCWMSYATRARPSG